jgi:hypothetical protein
LVSAQSLLNGFFPPTQKDDKFEEDLNWQPIAVHSAAGPNVQDPVGVISLLMTINAWMF